MWESPVLWVVGESVLEFAVGLRAGGGDSVGEGLGGTTLSSSGPGRPHPTRAHLVDPGDWQAGWSSIKRKALQLGGFPRSRASLDAGRLESLRKPRAGVRPHGISPQAPNPPLALVLGAHYEGQCPGYLTHC